MNQEKPIRIAVASDQDIYRRGLVSLVIAFPHTRLVGEARDEIEAWQLCELLEPEILLLALKNLPESGKELSRGIRKHWPKIKIIFFISNIGEKQIQPETEDVIYLSKDITEEELSSALRDIQHHLPVVHKPSIPDDFADEQVSPSITVSSSVPETTNEIQTRELKMAGRVQADIMPEKVPNIPGWDIAAGLVAARETSGDFYDFIPVDQQHWAVAVCDVTDKGIGAALFMALTSTLIRTYAVRYPTLPALTMDVVNQRMLSDTRGNMFVTAFFGILEPKLGRLRYVNAGHPPGLLISSRGAKPVDQLKPTGMALGMIEKTYWRQKVIKFSPGDTMLLYTDGITEAENLAGDFYGENRLMRVLRSEAGHTSQRILEKILSDVHDFVAGAKQSDDIAITVIRRKE